jgi:1-deoxy-D-xylulose-5-phosphate reductoisomerase
VTQPVLADILAADQWARAEATSVSESLVQTTVVSMG